MSLPPPISKEAVRDLVVAAVRNASTQHPGDAPATVAELKSVYRTWAQDWVTSEMGGGGGTGIYERDGAVFLWYQSLGRDWDIKLEWEGGRWKAKATAENSSWGIDTLDEFNAAELPLADAFMVGLHFTEPNRYRYG